MKYSLKCLSALILPLLLGVFTVVITFQQQKAAREQWIQDRLESREQRLEDRNLSKEQRQQEWLIANGQRDDLREDSIKRYKDELLVNYFKEMGDLLEKSNGSLMSNPISSILGRVKTLNVFRQLEGKRAALVLRFLYESRQLTDTNTSDALDISESTINGIDGNALQTLFPIGRMNLSRTILSNCNFNYHDVSGVDLVVAHLDNVSFSFIRLVYKIDLKYARLNNVSFSYSALELVFFESARLTNVPFVSASLHMIDFLDTRLTNVNFSSARLNYIYFSSAALENVDFSNATLVRIQFVAAKLGNVHFSTSLCSVLLSFPFQLRLISVEHRWTASTSSMPT